MVGRIKICSTCRKSKNIKDFYKSIKNKDGFQAQCKKCQGVVSIRRSKVTRKLRREALIEYKGGVCVHCLGVYPSPVYDLHHLDPSLKDFQFNNLANYTWERILEEADKCILLCANCHRIEHHVLKEVINET